MFLITDKIVGYHVAFIPRNKQITEWMYEPKTSN